MVSGPTRRYSIDDPEGFCRLIVRDPISGYRVQVNALYRNLGALETDGVDLQFNWNGDIGANGIFVNFLVSYVNSYKLQQQPGGDFTEYAGTLGAGGQFDYRTFTTFGYNSRRRRQSWFALDSSAGGRECGVRDESGHDRPADELLRPFRLFGGWSIRDNMQLRFGIDNLLDADPEIVGANPGQTNAWV